MKKRLLILSLCSFLLSGCAINVEVKTHTPLFLFNEEGNAVSPLNTNCEIHTYKKYSSSKEDEIYKAFDEEIYKVHKSVDAYNSFKDVKGIKYINSKYGKDEEIEVDPYLITLLEESINLTKLTKGKFNLTLGNLIDVWKNNFDSSSLYQVEPSKEVIEKAKQEMIPYDELDSYIILNKEKSSVKFLKYKDHDSIKINLGAVAKGFANDMIDNKFKSLNLNDPFIFAMSASSILLKGENPINDDKSFGINCITPEFTHKISNYSNLLTFKGYKNEGISTSGDYQKYFINRENGLTRSHILNPDTGYSSSFFCETVCVSSSLSSASLDVLTTTLMNTLSLQEAKEMIISFEEAYKAKIDYLLIIRDKNKYKLYLNENFNKRIQSTLTSSIESKEII